MKWIRFFFSFYIPWAIFFNLTISFSFSWLGSQYLFCKYIGIAFFMVIMLSLLSNSNFPHVCPLHFWSNWYHCQLISFTSFFFRWCPVIPCLILCSHWYVELEHFSNVTFTCRLSFQSRPRGNCFFVLLIFKMNSLLMILLITAYCPKRSFERANRWQTFGFMKGRKCFTWENIEFFQ